MFKIRDPSLDPTLKLLPSIITTIVENVILHFSTKLSRLDFVFTYITR